MRRRAMLLLAVPGVAHAQTLDPALVAAGWRLEVPRGKAPARFTSDGSGAVAITAEGAVGFLIRPLEPGSGRLGWRWRLDATPALHGSEARGSDRPVAVHVLFAGAGGGLWRALRGAMGPAELSGRALTYVWSGSPAGAFFPNPYGPRDGWLRVLRGAEAPLGRWLDEAVDVAADYRAAFGGEAPAPTHVALSADTDDRGGLARVLVTPPRWLP